MLEPTLVPRTRRRRPRPTFIKTASDLAGLSGPLKLSYSRETIHEASLAEVDVPPRCINAMEKVGIFYIKDLLVPNVLEKLGGARLGDAMLKLVAEALAVYGVDVTFLVAAIAQKKTVTTKRLKAEANDRRKTVVKKKTVVRKKMKTFPSFPVSSLASFGSWSSF